MTHSKKKNLCPKTKWQTALAQYNVASFDAKQPRENPLKSSADYYLALIQKARWFETR